MTSLYYGPCHGHLVGPNQSGTFWSIERSQAEFYHYPGILGLFDNQPMVAPVQGRKLPVDVYYHLAHTFDIGHDIAGYVLGYLGEREEFRQNPTADEAGDVLWYAVHILNHINQQPAQTSYPDDGYISEALLPEYAKKMIYHNKPAYARYIKLIVQARVDDLLRRYPNLTELNLIKLGMRKLKETP